MFFMFNILIFFTIKLKDGKKKYEMIQNYLVI